MKGLRPRRPGMRGEDGLSLIEAVISISVLMFVALGLTQTMIAGYRALRTTKTVQQATAVGDQTVEAARAVAYAALSHNTTDTTLAGDGEIRSACPGPHRYTLLRSGWMGHRIARLRKARLLGCRWCDRSAHQHHDRRQRELHREAIRDLG